MSESTHDSPKDRAEQIERDLREVARRDKAEFLPKFFQAFPGGYGEGDQFLGCVVPDQRKVARRHRDASAEVLVDLFASPWHECRLTGMLILVMQFETANRIGNPDRESQTERLFDFYLSNLDAADNWDIVDATAPKILGAFLLQQDSPRRLLDRLASANSLWHRRTAVVACLPLIKDGQFDDLLRLAQKLLRDEHDLMHKAIGWMLREVGKQDQDVLRTFLAEHVFEMPRTMLRYSTERLSATERTMWLKR